MKEWRLLVIERIHVVHSILNQGRRNSSVGNRRKRCADGAIRMTEVQDWLLVFAFPDRPDLCILSIHQHSRFQEEEVIMIAGVDVEVMINDTLQWGRKPVRFI